MNQVALKLTHFILVPAHDLWTCEQCRAFLEELPDKHPPLIHAKRLHHVVLANSIDKTANRQWLAGWYACGITNNPPSERDNKLVASQILGLAIDQLETTVPDESEREMIMNLVIMWVLGED